MNKKLVITLFLATTFIFTSCTSNTQSSKNADNTSGGGVNQTTNSEQKVTLNFLTSSSPLAPSDPNDKLIYQRLEQKTGIHINWTNYTSDQFVEKRNLDIASGAEYDAILNASFTDYDLLKNAENGIIMPIDNKIEDNMPNFKKVLDENPEYKGMLTAPDGHIYSLPWIEELGAGKESIHSVNCLPWINVEWINKLGLKVPATTDELKEVLMAFKQNDPTEGGNIIPMSFITKGGNEDCAWLFGAFGLGDNDSHHVVSNDGKVIFTPSQEDFKEAINYLSDLYANGLIDLESFTQDWNTYLAKGKDNRYGLYFTWDKGNITGMNDMYDVLPPLAGPDGQKNVTRTNNMGFDRGKAVIMVGNQNLDATIKWLDACFEPLQSIQDNWGTYGDTNQQNIFEFDETNNMLKHLPLEGTAPTELRQKTEVGGPLAILDEYYGTFCTKPDDAAWRLNILKDVMVPYMKADNIYPKVFFSVEDQDKLTTIETDLFAYVERKKAEWIQNGKVNDEWDSYIKELDRLGLQEWLDIKQKGYDNSTK